MMARYKIIALAAYAGIGIATFGHAAATKQAEEDAEYAACQATRSEDGYCWRTNELAPMAGLVAAPFWPLYWSWEAWS